MKARVFSCVALLCLFLGLEHNTLFAQDAQTDSERRVANKVIPLYPQLARPMKLEGTVKLEVLVQPNGTVKAVQVKGGSPLLAQAAEDALRRWKWEKADHETTELVQFHFTPR
jgi:TonB family protein